MQTEQEPSSLPLSLPFPNGREKNGEKSQGAGFKRIPLTSCIPLIKTSAEDEGGRQGLNPGLGDG